MIELLRYGAILGFSVAMGMLIFVVCLAAGIIAAIFIARKIADSAYKKRDEK